MSDENAQEQRTTPEPGSNQEVATSEPDTKEETARTPVDAPKEAQGDAPVGTTNVPGSQNDAPPAGPVGSVPNQVDVNNRLNALLQDVEALKAKAGHLLDIHADVAEIHKALDNVRTLIADKLGYKNNEQGNLVPKQ